MAEARGEEIPGGSEASFHETYLAPFEPEEASALRQVGALLVQNRPPGGSREAVVLQWQAFGQDLRYLEAYLGELSRYLHETTGLDTEAWTMIGALAKERMATVGELAGKFEPFPQELNPPREFGPGGWEGEGGFHETVLARLTREEAEAVRRVAGMLFAYNCEYRKPSGAEKMREPFRQWRAVGRDLRHLERSLVRFPSCVEELPANVAEHMKELSAALGALAEKFEEEVEAARP
jgi:hypothetical protein